jgi:hypothetical protein
MAATIRVTTFFLLAGCAAMCQELPSLDLPQDLQFDRLNWSETRRPDIQTWESLPDAPLLPSIQPSTKAEAFHSFISTGVQRHAENGFVTPGPQLKSDALYQGISIQRESSGFFVKHPYPPLTPSSRYIPSTSESFMGRASYAASSILIARDGSGRRKLNTSYFFSVLTLVASQAAHRSPSTRSTSAAFNNFGSTIGSDAGINVYHEFESGIKQLAKGLTPKLVSRIEKRITPDQTLHAVEPTPPRH